MNLTKLSLATLALAAMTSALAGPESLKGKPIPAFNMKRVNGGTISSKSLKGKVVVLDFWATWCGPCKAASPTMQSLHQKYAKQGLVIIGANITDPVAKAAAYPKEHKYSYAFTAGNDAYANKLGIENIPVFVFIDRKGVVQKVDTGFGPKSPADWEKAVKQLLAAK